MSPGCCSIFKRHPLLKLYSSFVATAILLYSEFVFCYVFCIRTVGPVNSVNIRKFRLFLPNRVRTMGSYMWSYMVETFHPTSNARTLHCSKIPKICLFLFQQTQHSTSRTEYLSTAVRAVLLPPKLAQFLRQGRTGEFERPGHGDAG